MSWENYRVVKKFKTKVFTRVINMLRLVLLRSILQCVSIINSLFDCFTNETCFKVQYKYKYRRQVAYSLQYNI